MNPKNRNHFLNFFNDYNQLNKYELQNFSLMSAKKLFQNNSTILIQQLSQLPNILNFRPNTFST